MRRKPTSAPMAAARTESSGATSTSSTTAAIWGPRHCTLRSVEITGYIEIDTNVRDICGIAVTNGDEPQPVFFPRTGWSATDEHGTPETFGIRLSNEYHMTRRKLGNGGPGGGNIRIHNSNPSNTGPDPMPDQLAMCAGVSAPSGGQIN